MTFPFRLPQLDRRHRRVETVPILAMAKMGLSPSTHEPTPSANRPARSRRTLVLAASLACAAACAAWLCAPHGPARQIDTVGGAGSPGPTAGLSSSEGCLGVRRFIAAFDRQTGHPSNASNKKAATSCRTPKSPGATDSFRFPIQLCQALGPAAPWAIRGVDCAAGCGCGWESARLIQWQQFAQGEYCGPARTEHVPEYRLRVDDELDLVYRLTREEQPNPYQLNVGDEIRVESATDPDLDRDLLIQPDGTITLRLLGQVRATGRTIPQLRDEIEQFYTKYYKGPAITVSPLRVNSKLDDLRNAVDSRFGQGGQNRSARVTPEGTISLPAIGVVQAQGLTLQELRVELREAYRKEVEGIEVIPVLVSRAPRYVYVLGEVNTPGRYELTGPTTLMQALAMAGSWRVGAQLRQVVVFRRGDDWRLLATMLDIRPALYAKQPCPPAEIWLSDADVIVVPKHPILVADEFIELVFTCGIYGVFPMNVAVNFSKLSTL